MSNKYKGWTKPVVIIEWAKFLVSDLTPTNKVQCPRCNGERFSIYVETDWEYLVCSNCYMEFNKNGGFKL